MIHINHSLESENWFIKNPLIFTLKYQRTSKCVNNKKAICTFTINRYLISANCILRYPTAYFLVAMVTIYGVQVIKNRENLQTEICLSGARCLGTDMCLRCAFRLIQICIAFPEWQYRHITWSQTTWKGLLQIHYNCIKQLSEKYIPECLRFASKIGISSCIEEDWIWNTFSETHSCLSLEDNR